MEVFKVFSQCRIQQRFVEQTIRSLTFLLAEVFKVITQDRVHLLLHGHGLRIRRRMGFFCALFPLEKSARCRAGGCESAPALQLIRAEPSSNGSSQFSDGSMPGNFWGDAAGRVWMRSFAFPGTRVCSGEDGEDIYWDEPG